MKLFHQSIKAARIVTDAVVNVPGVLLHQPARQSHRFHDQEWHNGCNSQPGRIFSTVRESPTQINFGGQVNCQVATARLARAHIQHALGTSAAGSAGIFSCQEVHLDFDLASACLDGAGEDERPLALRCVWLQ